MEVLRSRIHFLPPTSNHNPPTRRKCKGTPNDRNHLNERNAPNDFNEHNHPKESSVVKKCTTISLAIFLGVVLLSADGLTAAVTKLKGIRGGQHKRYTRLVLDAEGARPLKIGPTTAEGVTIVYEQLDLMGTSSALLRNRFGAVANVRHHRQANRSVIAISFKDPNTAARSFYMAGKSAEKGAYRLIIDLYPPGSAATGPGALVPVASVKASIPAPMAIPDPAAVPSPQAAVDVNETPLPAAESSEQLDKILPKAIETGSASQTVRVKMATVEQKQGVLYAEPSSNARTEGVKKNLLKTPPPQKASQAVVTEQPSIHNEFRDGKERSITVLKRAVPMVAKPANILRIQPSQSGIKDDVSGVIERATSEVSIQRKVPIYMQESIGLVELTLKLLLITLSCLVILFLHRANKIATNRYDALRQFQ